MIIYMIVHINTEYLLGFENTIEKEEEVWKAARYTEIIVSYLLTYLLNDDSEFEFEFDNQYNEKVIEKTTQNIRDIFPEMFVMNYCVTKLDNTISKLGITVDTIKY